MGVDALIKAVLKGAELSLADGGDLQHTQCPRHSETSAQMQWQEQAQCEPTPQ